MGTSIAGLPTATAKNMQAIEYILMTTSKDLIQSMCAVRKTFTKRSICYYTRFCKR